MLNVEENENGREEENPITHTMFVWMLFAPNLSCVTIYLYIFAMLVLL